MKLRRSTEELLQGRWKVREWREAWVRLAKESTKTFISYEKISRLSSGVRNMCGKSVGTMSETKLQSHEKRLRKACLVAAIFLTLEVKLV